LRELIELGELPPEATLPSERTLAAAMHVSRTTAVAAYETLRSDGLVERRQGSGTRVSAARRRGEREIVSSNALSGAHAADQFLSKSLATVDFSMAALPCLPSVPKLMARISEGDYLKLGAEQPGYHPRGLVMLREQIADLYTASGVTTSPDQILVTNGAQQALELIAHGCLQPGDDVVTETPTYRGSVEAIGLANCRLRSVTCDENGMDTRQLEQLDADRPPRLVYVQSAVHNPTGFVMANGRKRHLAELDERFNLIVVDDSALEVTLFTGAPRTPLAALTRTDLLLTIGSMSKLFWGGLRVGWIRGDMQVISRLAQMKGIADLGTSLVSQLIAFHLLEGLEEAKEQRRDQLTDGLAYLTSLLTKHLPEWSWQTPRGGASLWVRVPVDSVTSFAHVAMRSGVAILPGTLFSPDGLNDDHTRLPFSLQRSTMRTGVLRLAEAWTAYQSGLGVVPVQSATT
jgi:DNA-binding transcriptional MocR family regulator